MRIIGGMYRSRLIEMPKGDEVRPTQDKVRQAIFNILQDVSDRTVLDLYAGSGAYGIEALSRGARHVTFVDNNAGSIRTIQKNLDSLAIDHSSYSIIRAEASRAPASLERSGKAFDLIFLDPPFRQELAKNSLITLEGCAIVAQSAVIVVEHYKRDELPTDLKKLTLLTERAYGNTRVTIYRSI